MDRPDRRQFLGAAGVLVGTALAGCSGDDDDNDSSEDQPLAVENLTLTAAQPEGYREFDEVEDAVYAEDDTVWFYFEPVGASTEAVDDGVRVDFTTTLTVDGPDGEELFDDEQDVTQTIREESLDGLYLFWNFQPPRPTDPGEYTAVVGLIDEGDGEEASETTTFTIET